MAHFQIVPVARYERFSGAKAEFPNTPIDRDEDRGVCPVQQIGAVIPLRRIRRPAALRECASGEKQVGELPVRQAGYIADGADARTECYTFLGQRQCPDMPLGLADIGRHGCPRST